jgi:hypothetical protein
MEALLMFLSGFGGRRGPQIFFARPAPHPDMLRTVLPDRLTAMRGRGYCRNSVSKVSRLRLALDMARDLYHLYDAEVQRDSRSHERDPISGVLIDRQDRLTQLRRAWQSAERRYSFSSSGGED